MPRRPCYWTRKLELQLVEFIRQREFIWKPIGNTNHHIQQKYKAYAEFAAKLGRGFTARSVRDRWVNIRCTFNHNLRRVDKSKETSQSHADIYVPCWPLWKPLQFLRAVDRRDATYDDYPSVSSEFKGLSTTVKEELASDFDDTLPLRQRGQRTDRPRRKKSSVFKTNTKCKRVVDDLVKAMKPLTNMSSTERQAQSYWFFGKHVTERLNCMKGNDAKNARQCILKVLNEYSSSKATNHPEDVKLDDIFSETDL